MGPLINLNLGNPQTANRYAYARNNPLRFLDPTGAMDADIIITKPGMTWHEALGIELPSSRSETDTATTPAKLDKTLNPSPDRDDIIITRPGQTWHAALGITLEEASTAESEEPSSCAEPTWGGHTEKEWQQMGNAFYAAGFMTAYVGVWAGLSSVELGPEAAATIAIVAFSVSEVFFAAGEACHIIAFAMRLRMAAECGG